MDRQNLKTLACGAPLALASAAATGAQATTLSGILTADNAFQAYISTDDSVLGTLIGSGDDHTQVYSLTATALTGGVTNYLHVQAEDAGLVFMFVGSFHLSDANFHFNNGGQDLLTNITDWRASLTPGSWFAPTGAPVDEGTNPFCCTPWGNTNMTTGAHFLWAANGFSNSITNFSTPIFSDVAAGAPEPAAWVMMVIGFLGLGAMLRRPQVYPKSA